MSALAFSGSGLQFLNPPGRDAAVPLPWVADAFNMSARNAARAVRRNPDFFGDDSRYKIRVSELKDVVRSQSGPSLPLPVGGYIVMLTLKGVLALAFVTDNAVAFMLCLRMIDVLARIATSSDPSLLNAHGAGSRIGEKSQTVILNPSARLLEHNPVEKSIKPRKRSGPKVTCDLDEFLHDWLLEFAASKGMTKAEATRQIIRDRRELEESTTV